MRTGKKGFRRIAAMICALALCASMLPTAVFADPETDAGTVDSIALDESSTPDVTEPNTTPENDPQNDVDDSQNQKPEITNDNVEESGNTDAETDKQTDGTAGEDDSNGTVDTTVKEQDNTAEDNEKEKTPGTEDELPLEISDESKKPTTIGPSKVNQNTLEMPINTLADGPVAQIGGDTYETLDAAVEAAADGATIELLQDATTEGLNLSKNLTIQAAEGVTEKPTVTFTKYGIALWGKALTFKNLNVVMKGIGSTPYTAEWNWMTICANKNASLTLYNTNMTMDGTGTPSDARATHAIYFCSNNKLNLENGSVLTIKNYSQDALEWDGGDGGYNVNITDSTFVSDNNRSGFTGTFYATISNSKVDVVHSSGNGSNGTHYVIENNSTVNFSDNGSHGLSAGDLTIQDSTVTCLDNGMTGIIFTGSGKFINSDITISGTKGTSYWNAGLRLYTASSRLTVDKDTKLSIQNNFVTGIFMDASTQMTIEEGANVVVTGNEAKQKYYNGSGSKDLAKRGGGLTMRSNASAKLSASTQIYNNHAALSGDDIYLENNASLTFFPVGSDWKLDDCKDPIDGWYYDESESRWNVHDGNNYSAELFESFANGTAVVNGAISLKAAHSEVATLQPADITIYMGGDNGYDGVTDANGTILNNNSLPEPGYYITLPEDVNTALQNAGYVDAGNTPVDLSEQITIRTIGADEVHNWSLHKYGNSYSAALGKYIYAIAPEGSTQPLRLTFTDGNTVIDGDAFKPSQEETLQAEYQMNVYSDLVDKGQVFLEVEVPGGNTYFCKVTTEPGTLNVRYVTGNQDSVVTPVYNSIEAASEADDPEKEALDKAYVIRDPDTKFYINGSGVDVTESKEYAHVSLLFDDVISEDNTEGVSDYSTQLIGKAVETAATGLVNVKTQAKYLDLVDANNGNVWLKPSEAVTVYWPYPAGTDASTDFRLVHFVGLDRDMGTGEVAEQIASTPATPVELKKDEYGISFTTDSFSPFVLVWGDQPADEGDTEQPTQTPAPTAAPTPAPTAVPTPAPTAAPAVIPQTGDTLPVGLLGGVAVVAVAAFVVLLVLRKRKHDD